MIELQKKGREKKERREARRKMGKGKRKEQTQVSRRLKEGKVSFQLLDDCSMSLISVSLSTMCVAGGGMLLE